CAPPTASAARAAPPSDVRRLSTFVNKKDAAQGCVLFYFLPDKANARRSPTPGIHRKEVPMNRQVPNRLSRVIHNQNNPSTANHN
ncbi:MAG: hypothetical protein WA089_09135, partial [Anaerolineae bacterium]